MDANITRIDPAGRLSISAQHRKALGLESVGPVIVTLVGDEVRIRSMATAMSELQADAARFLQDEQSSVDTFIAELMPKRFATKGSSTTSPCPLSLWHAQLRSRSARLPGSVLDASALLAYRDGREFVDRDVVAPRAGGAGTAPARRPTPHVPTPPCARPPPRDSRPPSATPLARTHHRAGGLLRRP